MAAKSYRNLARTFGQVLRQRREATGLSQEALAQVCGIHRTYVSMLERGINAPSLPMIATLAQALGTRPHQLVKDAEERRP